ncbi:MULTISPECIES: hypothetical protein [unclassified Coleofasciculus]|uniref:hypothetical protein n=1 Tax=unclassified Coleofasciculus TaxID=2692782 RepID=UPI00187F5CFC|nr:MULTISPECIES: hypothetical protein [unclassified Coleofasciculus]MBE9127566.1 hypothetical protein [Coleofasciculus sp. LEGE 07081]MBE9147190.1 hypothetical protein [Coleofasciculus sp. LEGE 07092]
MNSRQVCNNHSGKGLNLPEPDPDNITVLTRNLPNTPILPWNHYDSPWSDAQAANSEILEITDEASDECQELPTDTSEEAENLDVLKLDTAELDEEFSEEELEERESLLADYREESETDNKGESGEYEAKAGTEPVSTQPLDALELAELDGESGEEELTGEAEGLLAEQLGKMETSTSENEGWQQDSATLSEKPSETAAQELKQLG